MRKLLSFIIIPVLSIALVAILSGTAAFGKKATQTFIYMAAFPPICAGPNPCPDVAFASTGESIEISNGFGLLTLHPKSIVFGSGLFFADRGLEEGGEEAVSGTWEAVELLSFKSYGIGDPDLSTRVDPPFRAGSFQAGRAQIRIQLFEEDGKFLADAILEVNCMLPGAKMPGAAIEGVTVRVLDGLNFNEAEAGATLFIECPTEVPGLPC